MPQLIVNADDFGITEGTNQAIVDAFRSGIITSTSLLANGYAFDHAVNLAQQTPALGIGVHLTLTEGPAISENSNLLLGPNRELPLSNQPFVQALLQGKLPVEAIRREFEAQITRVIQAGIKPTHVDGHKYIHLLPGITAIAAQVARQLGIPVMRVPCRSGDRLLSRPVRVPGLMALLMMGMVAAPVAHRAGLKITDRVIGFIDTGHLSQERVLQLLKTPRPGITELLSHPAYPNPELTKLLAKGYRWIASYEFEQETRTVSDPAVRQRLVDAGWTLCSFAALS